MTLGSQPSRLLGLADVRPGLLRHLRSNRSVLDVGGVEGLGGDDGLLAQGFFDEANDGVENNRVPAASEIYDSKFPTISSVCETLGNSSAERR